MENKKGMKIECRAVTSFDDDRQFTAMLSDQYEKLGFLADVNSDKFMPGPDTRKFGAFFENELAGICALNEVTDRQSEFHQRIPGLAESSGRVFEFNNVVIDRNYRGGWVLPVLLIDVIRQARSLGATTVCGIVRYEVLRYFVNLGAMPVAQQPEKVLSGGDYDDYIIYFDIADADSVRYLERQVASFLQREDIMASIRAQRRAEQKTALKQAA